MKIRISYNTVSEKDPADIALLDVRRRFPYCKVNRPEPKAGEKYSHIYIEIAEPGTQSSPYKLSSPK